MKKNIGIFLVLTGISLTASAQKWQKGFFIDRRGQKVEGVIRTNPSGKAPIKDEGFIIYKDSEKGTETRISASDMKSFVAGADSFVVAHAPRNTNWSKKETDFVRVALNEDLKLYVLDGGSGGGGSKFSFHPGISIGTGGYGGVGGGIGYGGDPYYGGGSGNTKVTYYYGANTAEMEQLTPQNFTDIMVEIMGDEPDAVQAIRERKFTYGNIDKLIAYFKSLKAAHRP
ncbi:hypothetical protein C8P68_104249 [Mucilaginibacter yixingensis]|uniref:Uncharacterized protein n=1 Tax=Mucilaginibacter yixingensis TaxID=1295612 RepID=A0A2T5J9L1_9SPHI|nr:hypothetical protein [Mucilaginibacter yixingensis]PTQ96760.1 hypothetical protein C8P68_104249 [Mucilaginibacter yixingensis]